MLNIQRSLSGETVVFALSGRIELEDVAELQRLLGLESKGQAMVLDLKDLTIIDREAVKFLAACKEENIKLDHSPAYIREWIEAERGRGGRA